MLARTPLRRNTPLARSWIKRRPRRKTRMDAVRKDPERLSFVRGLPCSAKLSFPDHQCGGEIEAHHAGRRPRTGLKAADDTAIPLCHKGHVFELHGNAGPFKGWPKARLRDWQDACIEATRLLFAAYRGEA